MAMFRWLDPTKRYVNTVHSRSTARYDGHAHPHKKEITEDTQRIEDTPEQAVARDSTCLELALRGVESAWEPPTNIDEEFHCPQAVPRPVLEEQVPVDTTIEFQNKVVIFGTSAWLKRDLKARFESRGLEPFKALNKLTLSSIVSDFEDKGDILQRGHHGERLPVFRPNLLLTSVATIAQAYADFRKFTPNARIYLFYGAKAYPDIAKSSVIRAKDIGREMAKLEKAKFLPSTRRITISSIYYIFHTRVFRTLKQLAAFEEGSSYSSLPTLADLREEQGQHSRPAILPTFNPDNLERREAWHVETNKDKAQAVILSYKFASDDIKKARFG
ncbi:uncharacterized protein J7T54_005472 [Emericellopsis cladophorae]|uniref:Uncharacterized protein n=1 Tax=Emericellopsis cladophorae TaxID=2686198 RepID=A0A9Q0BA70_9HYPO|nr:uncharacterized protein J7T54_005472 [Emericellopsis cladophorae]KAI6777546.1 hypothetical protein J7T54_005472 [Emericellopsis cladophorae]